MIWRVREDRLLVPRDVQIFANRNEIAQIQTQATFWHGNCLLNGCGGGLLACLQMMMMMVVMIILMKNSSNSAKETI